MTVSDASEMRCPVKSFGVCVVMAAELKLPTRCPACSRPLAVGPDRAPPDRCPACGTRLDRKLARDDVVSEGDRHVLVAATDAEDGLPYAVMGDKPIPRCPSCDRPFLEDETVCSTCHYDRALGRRTPRAVVPFDQTWDAGLSFRIRFAAFLACQIVNAILAWLATSAAQNIPRTLGGWAVLSAAQAFVLGTYDRIRITRSVRGKVSIIKTMYVGFFPLAAKTLDWKEPEEVAVRYSDIGLLEWIMLFVLLGYGILPGVLWWWFAIRPGRVTAALTKDRGAVVHQLYSGSDVEKAQEIAMTIHKLTGMPYVPVG